MKKRIVTAVGLACVMVFLAPACSDDESPVGGQMRTGNGEPPAIVSISWASAPGCQPGTRSDVTITVTVSDPDTESAALIFAGDVTGCNGPITSSITDISCPQSGIYMGTVTVADPEGNSDTQSFNFGSCESGSSNF